MKDTISELDAIQYAADLATLKSSRDQVQTAAFNHMRGILRMTDEELSHTGHKTRADAVVATYKYAQEAIDKLTKAYLKKYPD